jgi:putative DNA primase/helicase
MPEITIFTDAAWMRRADELIAEYSFKSWAGRLALGDLYPPDEAADAEPETAFNSLADLANLPIWVAWREEKKPDGSLTKVPKNPRTGGNASVPTNPRTYGTRAAAERRAEQITKTTKGGIGVVLGPLPNGQHLAAIDLDSCRDVASGAITPRAQEVIRRFNTYAEISPSNTGVKFFFQMTAVDIVALYKLLGFNHNGEQIKRKSFEPGDHREMAIDTARFYAVTDQRLEDYPETFRLVPFSDVAWFLKTAGPNYLAAAQQSKNAFEASGDRQRADRDQSGSGHGFRFMQDCHADGMDYEQARAAILADESKAGEWANRVDRPPHDHVQEGATGRLRDQARGHRVRS